MKTLEQIIKAGMTDEQVNEMAADLLGYCNHDSGKPFKEYVDGQEFTFVRCIKCGYETLRGDWGDVPDFINDSNAAQQLVSWMVKTQDFKMSDTFADFLDKYADAVSVAYALTLPPRTITIAVLYAAGFNDGLAKAIKIVKGDAE